MDGKKEVLIMPPPKDPIVKLKNAIKTVRTKNLLFNENLKVGS
tara:strand:+ start:2195 stop:2323 length:129 start_codon:yes stop_codon:yes gene_type:complete